MNGPAIVFGLRCHLSRNACAFLTQTGGPSCRDTLGSAATANSKRKTASLSTRSKRESETRNSSRWNASKKARCAFRNCGYRTSSVIAGAGIEIARRPPPRCFARDRSLGTESGFTGRGKKNRRSEEHTSELQSPCNLVCRLLLEKKKASTPDPARSI